jgi:hypothetical protein
LQVYIKLLLIKVTFIPNEINVEKNLIGRLYQPISFQSSKEISQLVASSLSYPQNVPAIEPTSWFAQTLNETTYNDECMEKNLEIELSDSGGLTSVVYLKTLKKLIVNDYKNAALYILDTTSSIGLFGTFKHELLKKPEELCVGKDDQIFVSEHSNGDRILIFDANLNYLRQIKLKPMNVSKMKIDLLVNQNLLHISDRRSNRVVVRYSENNKFKTTIDILRPEYIEFDVNYIYITSYPDFTHNGRTGEIEGLQKKSNCIFLLNKSDFRTVRFVPFDDWLGPEGLFIDKNSNILTVAAVLDRQLMKSSSSKYIHVIAANGTLAEKIEIEDYDDDDYNEIYCIVDKYIFICKKKSLVGYKLFY